MLLLHFNGMGFEVPNPTHESERRKADAFSFGRLSSKAQLHL